MEGRLGVNWRFFAKQFASWMSTLFIAAFGTAALFAQGLYAPSKVSGATVMFYEAQMSGMATVSADGSER
jgi:solute carrier family 20 (sodium-dependent phosphate transporter)